MKICFKCNIEKPLSEFYKHPKMFDGHLNKCKECNKIDVRKNYRKNISHYKEYERSRTHLPHRLKLRGLTGDELLICHLPKTHLAYPTIKANSGQLKKIREPLKYKARMKSGNAIRDGRLTKQSCAWCGTNKNIHAHHEDYSKPLDVIWLCASHHSAVHHGRIKIYDNHD